MSSESNTPSDRFGFTNVPYDAAKGAGGGCGRHGVYIGYGCPGCRAERLRDLTTDDSQDEPPDLVTEDDFGI